MKSKKIAFVSEFCVACGSCIRECPMGAISINTGIKAKIDIEKCVGCGKCSKVCPATAIDIIMREVKNDNKEMV